MAQQFCLIYQLFELQLQWFILVIFCQTYSNKNLDNLNWIPKKKTCFATAVGERNSPCTCSFYYRLINTQPQGVYSDADEYDLMGVRVIDRLLAGQLLGANYLFLVQQKLSKRTHKKPQSQPMKHGMMVVTYNGKRPFLKDDASECVRLATGF